MKDCSCNFLKHQLIFRNSAQKEIFVDFMGAQIKTLSFLAYIVRIYQVKGSYIVLFV